MKMDQKTIMLVAAFCTALTTIAIFFKRIARPSVTVVRYSLVAVLAPIRWHLERKIFKEQFARLLQDTALIKKEVTLDGTGSMMKMLILNCADISLLQQIQWATEGASINPTYYLRANGQLRWANNAYCKLVDRQFKDLEGDGWQSYIHWQDRKRVLEEWEKTIEGKREFELEYRLFNEVLVKDGATPLRHDNSDLLGYRGLMRIVPTPHTP